MDTILGYTFKNTALLEEALVTPACKISSPGIRDNQRLEFLGDAVLGMLAADQLYHAAHESEEGDLTVRRTHMVSTRALCEAAARCGIAPLLKRNVGAQPLNPHAKTIADAIEAIIGATWLDGGLEAARQVFNALELKDSFIPDGGIDNPKGTLQVMAQAMKPQQRPVYTLISRKGPPHAPIFHIRVSVTGLGEAEAEARSHQAAEQQAAARLLAKAKVCSDPMFATI